MKYIRQWILSSFIYNLILNICQIGAKSFFFKPQLVSTYSSERREIYSKTIIYRGIMWVDQALERLYRPLRRAWENSYLVNLIKKIADFCINHSSICKFISQLTPVYIIPLFVYIDYLMRSYNNPFSSVWDELLAVLFVLWIFLRRVLKNKRLVLTPLDLPILIYALVFLFLVFANSPDLYVAIEGYRTDVQYLIWFYLVTQLLDNKKAVYGTIWIFTIAIGLLGLHGVYQFFTGAPMLGNWVDSGETITTRAYSIIRSPNAYASLLVLNIPVAFSLLIGEKDILKKLVALMSLLFMGLGLIFSFSRGAWFFGFLAVLIVILFVARRMMIPIFTVALAALFNINTVWTRISYMFTAEYADKNARGGRAFRWSIGLMEWSKSKLMGLGIGRYGGAVATNHKLTPFYMDNYYMKTLTEAGIIGLSTLILLLLITIWQIVAAIRNTLSTKARIIAVGLFSGVIAVLGHNYVENIFETPFMVTYFWTYVALILSLNRIGHEKDE